MAASMLQGKHLLRLAISMLFSLLLSANAFPSDTENLNHWPTPYLIKLTDQESVETPGRHALLHVERDGPIPLETLMADRTLWHPNDEDSVNLGLGAPPAWLSFSLENATGKTGDWIISANRITQKVFELYVVQDGIVKTLISGPRSDEALAAIETYGFLAHSLTLKPNEIVTVYMHFKGGQASWLPFFIGSPLAFAEDNFTLTLFSLASIIGIGTLVLVNLFYFFSTRQYVYFIYCAAEVFYLIVALHLQGFTTRNFFYQFPDFGSAFGAIAATISVMCWIIFAIRFFDTQLLYPRLTRFYKGYIYVCIAHSLAIIAALFFAPEVIGPLAALGSLIVTFPWFILPVHALHASARHGAKYAFVAPAWLLFSAVLIYSTLSNLMLVPELPLHWYILGPVGFVEALLISIALANRVRINQNQLIETKTALAESLEEKLEARKREAKLAQEKALALQDLAEKGKLVLAASHDTRHMLGAIRQYSSNLHIEASPEKRAQAADQITDLSDMLEHMQSMMIEGAVGGPSTAETLAIETVNAQSLLDAIILMHSSDAREQGSRLSVCSHTFRFPTDRVMLTRILSNLLSNAIKYSGSKRILTTARKHDTTLIFQVWDQGCGLSKNDLAALLNQEAPSLRLQHDTEGTGSGIRISSQLAQQLGGQLSAQSQLGKGTVFTLSLPIVDAAPSQTKTYIVGASRNWPALQQEIGPSFEFIDTEALGQMATTQEQLIILDPAMTGPEELSSLQHPPENICLATYDRTILTKGEWTKAGQDVIYKPVTKECIETLLALRKVRHNNR